MENQNHIRYGLLDREDLCSAIKTMSKENLDELCAEIRQFLLEHVSQTGGHLASNLGSVELTVALHRVYDSSRDRIVFDVGHQSYSHKIITGRRDMFNTLRCHGGISGFPKPYEADDDAFVAGHASDSVSVALGMAHARTLKKQNYDVVAVIGDGALTGGLAYEGLSNLGGGSEPMVVILNDNGMSINGNVGGMARLLSEERVKPGYINFKRWYRNAFGSVPALYDALKAAGLSVPVMARFMESLPLSSSNMSWILFFAAGFLLGLVWEKVSEIAEDTDTPTV